VFLTKNNEYLDMENICIYLLAFSTFVYFYLWIKSMAKTLQPIPNDKIIVIAKIFKTIFPGIPMVEFMKTLIEWFKKERKNLN
jgi:predicted phosphoadenosine phosphosulfate sulfurtransferase